MPLSRSLGLALVLAAIARAGVPGVHVQRLGVDVSAQASQTTVEAAVGLLKSCASESTSYVASSTSWQDALASDSYIHIAFATPREILVHGQQRRVTEILLPLQSSRGLDHIHVRTADNLLVFTKFDAIRYSNLVVEPPLSLGSTPPFDVVARYRELAPTQ
jgi:hypothetical protein